MKHQIKIEYTEKGFANYFPEDNHIEINKKLKSKKKLMDYVLKHELGHKKEFDLSHDLKIPWKIIFSLILFVLKNPSTWRDFSPIQIRKNKIIYDVNMIILWTFSIILITILLKILIKVF